MAHFNFVISQNAKWGHAGFYIDCHRMTVPENILLQNSSGVVGCLSINLLQIYQRVCQLRNFENRLTFGEVMGKSLVSCFFDSRCNAEFVIEFKKIYTRASSSVATTTQLMTQAGPVAVTICVNVSH